MTNSPHTVDNENPLGTWLRDRRTKLDPAALGFSMQRRRTPGLRREEVAQRANISATWYTWLEQGRGGAPSAAVLDRVATALMLTDVEREHLFLLGLGRTPEVRYHAAEGVTPRLQRVLDAMPLAPAIVRTSTWDVVAWNRAAAAVLTDYGRMVPAQRNILRLIFLDPRVRTVHEDWHAVTRFVVGAFRADVARAGASREVASLVAELSEKSPEFAVLWRDNEVSAHSGGTKTLHHPVAGDLVLEYSAFAVDERPDLCMLVYNPATPADADRVRLLIDRKAKADAQPRR